VAFLKIDNIIELAAAPQPKAFLAGHIVHPRAVLEWIGRADHRHLLLQLGRQIGVP